MGIIEAYKALKDISYRVSSQNKPLQVIDANENHAMICKGDTCFELFKPEKIDNQYVVPVVKWRGINGKFKSMERKYIALTELYYYTNSVSFVDFVEKLKKIKEVENDLSRLQKFFDYLHLMFI